MYVTYSVEELFFFFCGKVREIVFSRVDLGVLMSVACVWSRLLLESWKGGGSGCVSLYGPSVFCRLTISLSLRH